MLLGGRDDGVPADTLWIGRVASIEQPTPYQSGQTLADMLLALIEGRALATRQVLRQPVFQPGDSIGPPT